MFPKVVESMFRINKSIHLIYFIVLLIVQCTSSLPRNTDSYLPDYLPKRKTGINSIKLFDQYKKPRIRAFLLGNLNYRNRSERLKYTKNDILIYKLLLKHILNVPLQNIHDHYDLTLNQFKSALQDFAHQIKKDELVLIIYAGHGNTDGMPIFIDSKTISVHDFHQSLNSFKNDTVLIMDSCYSAAEGLIQLNSSEPQSGIRGGIIKKRKKNLFYDKQIMEPRKFRNNVLRIYSALAHQASMEGPYRIIRPFHPYLKETYQFLDQLGYKGFGNGLFTLLFASFFAERHLSDENYTFVDLSLYVQNKFSHFQEYGFPTQRSKMNPFIHNPFINKKNYYVLEGSLKDKLLNNKEIIYRKACEHQNEGYYNNAIKLFQKIKYYKDSKIRLSECYVELGLQIVYDNSDEAIRLYNKALSYNNNSFRAINFLGQVYDEMKANYNLSLKYYQKIEYLAKKNRSQFWLSSAYINIGAIYLKMGQYDKSLNYFQNALKNIQKVFGNYHPITATNYNNIGYIYFIKAQYQKSVEYYLKSLKVLKIITHKNNSNLSIIHNNIGLSYYEMKSYDHALNYFYKALDYAKKSFIKNNIPIAKSYNNIGLIYTKKGQYNKALNHFKIALIILERTLGKYHPDTGICYNNIGLVLMDTKQFHRAIVYFSKALKTFKKIFGEIHSNTGTIYLNLAGIYYVLDKYDKAMYFILKAINVFQRSLGDNHPMTKYAKHSLKLINKKMD